MDRDPYYDSARDKPDRSEFGSLRMPMHESRAPRASVKPWGRIIFVVGAVVLLVMLARRLLA
ncbi:hypothetical protein QTI66_11420 [Variovorax sp. J22R133]|uniref:hypothetical protein n=1 Tax=Variovorax brevis TaxID=3053503 RepID=UPI0025785BE0|nr:hypothetical protein [Variovorax sp. J22R133]MDM0112759.1 hypothetical protein [Variovorax sp. J22R133]